MNLLARQLVLALQFFTRIPLPGALVTWAGYTPALMQASLCHFPAIGWITGALSAGCFLLTLHLWGAPVLTMAAPSLLMLLASLAAVLCSIFVTGALHEDGLADVADALGGAASPARALAIMKDSRVGSYGVLALIASLALRVLLLACMGIVQPFLAVCVIVGSHVISRFFPLLLIRLLPYARTDDSSKTVQAMGEMHAVSLWSAALWCLPLALCYWLPQGAWLVAILGVATLASAVAAWAMYGWFRKRLGGYTGDCLGATQQVCDMVFLAAALTAMLRAMGQL